MSTSKKVYTVFRENEVEHFDAEKVHNTMWSGKRLIDMTKEELMTHLHVIANILNKIK